MGCDISFFVEHKKNGVWVEADKTFAPIDSFNRKHVWYNNRSYNLFSILAGVRGRYQPIKDPVGIPKDASPRIAAAWAKDRDYGDHSASYYTLNELNIAKDKIIEQTGLVDMRNYKMYLADEIPDTWFTYALPVHFEIISNKEMNRMINLMAFSDNFKHFTKITFSMTYYKTNSYFWDVVLAAAAKLDPDPNNVRIIFWFDS